MTCKNCDNIFEGSFCNECGQKSSVQKINWTYLKEEVSNSVFQVNRGILYTIKELIIRPGESIRSFLAGKRKKHFKPIGFVFLTSTLYFLASRSIGKETYLSDAILGITEGLTNGGQDPSISTSVLDWVANNHAYTTLILLPFFSLASYLAFNKFDHNYFEHLVINAFITGQQMLIYLVFTLIFMGIKEDNYLTQGAPLLLGFTYNILVFFKLFDKATFFKRIISLLSTYFYFIGLTILLFIIILVLSGAK